MLPGELRIQRLMRNYWVRIHRNLMSLVIVVIASVWIGNTLLQAKFRENALVDAEAIATSFNVGTVAGFMGLIEAESKGDAIDELFKGAISDSCWGPDEWPPPEISGDRVAIAAELLVFERWVNEGSVPEETVSALKVKGTEIDWLKPGTY